MTIVWLAPAALIGLASIALPIAIHLLVRQHARSIAFPSLRFLRETQLAAFRRRTVEDAALLLCRIGILVAAVIALAGPIVQTASRTGGYAKRVSRAIVAIDSTADDAIAREASGAFQTATFKRTAVADALADATRWLDRQPPSSREIVIAGALRRGVVTEGDLATVPRDIGIRFEPRAGSPQADVTVPVLMRRNGVLVRVDRAMHLALDATRVVDGAAAPVSTNPIAIIANGRDTPLADAALGAVLDVGVVAPARSTIIVWTGADESRVRVAANTDVIRMAVPDPPSSAADAVMAALQSASRSTFSEPVPITAEQLAAWSRPAGPPSPAAPLADEGDRRWLWATAIVLMALETWLRRSRAKAIAQPSMDEEARVA
jgi:hypothetical protein